MIYYPETVEFYTRFCNDISQLILWICLHKGHRYELRPAIPAKFSGQEWRNQFELLLGNGWVLHKVLKWYLPTHSVDLSSQGPQIRAKFSGQEWRNQFEVLLGNGWVLQGYEMISPNSFCGFVFTRAIDMILDPPFLQNLLNKNEETNLNYYSETVGFYTRFCNDISQLILWTCLHKGHRYGLLQNPWTKMKKQFDSSTERCWVPESSFLNRWKHS